MEYISSETLTKANIKKESEILFVSLWLELFHKQTVDTYRTRVMNARTILAELKQVVSERFETEMASENVHFVVEEAIRILTQDQIVHKYWPMERDYLVGRLKQKKTDKTKQSQKQFPALISILQENLQLCYSDLLFKEIEAGLSGSHSTEVFADIVRAFATEMIAQGFSFEYLYYRKNFFLDTKQSLIFSEKWKRFRQEVQSRRRSFRVYIMMHGPKLLSSIREGFDIKIHERGEINNSEFSREFLIQGQNHIFEIPCSGIADPFSAARVGYAKLLKFLDHIRFEFRNEQFPQTAPTMDVLDETTRNRFLITLSNFLPGAPAPGDLEKLTSRMDGFRKAIDEDARLLDEDSVKKIQNSFRYFGISLGGDIDESRFLHAWIALEFLLRTGEAGTIIEPMLSYVPKILGLNYPQKILNNFSSDLYRMRISRKLLTSLGVQILPTEKYSSKSLYFLLADPARASQLEEGCEHPLMKLRVRELRSVFSNARSVEGLIAKHYEDVRWHLRRLNRVRNSLVHSAGIEYDIKQLLSNLDYYYTTTINSLLVEIGKLTDRSSVESILSQMAIRFDYAMNSLSKGIIPDFLLPST